MKRMAHTLRGALLTLAAAASCFGQSPIQGAQPDPQVGTPVPLEQTAVPSGPAASLVQPIPSTGAMSPVVEALVDFRSSDVKFDIQDLMDTLRDRQHEGWVLTAYPDPKTGDPLIGAGFTLNLPERAHLQSDAENPHPFIEPSSAQLWQAAGLAPERLQRILNAYREHQEIWTRRVFMKRVHLLPPDISEEEAVSLLRISSIQAIYNAKAYCRNFDQLTASQQMALSQLVYQMGVNLEEFDQFLSLLNGASSVPQNPDVADATHWRAVQHALVESQWAHKYRIRAIAVIAMLDPQYRNDPRLAEVRLHSELPPPAVRHRGRRGASLRMASYKRRVGGTAQKKASRVRNKRRA